MQGAAISAPCTFYALETMAIKSSDYDALGNNPYCPLFNCSQILLSIALYFENCRS